VPPGGLGAANSNKKVLRSAGFGIDSSLLSVHDLVNAWEHQVSNRRAGLAIQITSVFRGQRIIAGIEQFAVIERIPRKLDRRSCV